MKLHSDIKAFGVLLDSVSEQTGIRMDILEKDYYVTLLLRELAKKQVDLPVYFKGGTALYKAVGSMKRFSEDIDLTVEIKDCSKSQGKKRLENAANSYSCMKRTHDKEKESNTKGSITSVYEYVPVVAIDEADMLQRFGYVKVEATSFTVSEPTELLLIEPLIYSQSAEDHKKLLKELYEVEPFDLKTIKMERIFADKLLAAEFYYQRSLLFDVSKHLYDIVIMMQQERIQRLISDDEDLIKMISYKRMEERERIGSDLTIKPFGDFSLFDKLNHDEKLKIAFLKMQDIYVFGEKDKIDYKKLLKVIEGLFEVLLKLEEDLAEK
ncbi:MAG: nucleotidyl transferase AbiEii/AbiGii toxin family protein [Synergistaceae bacterium]|nr:nucleotidyl transferase AbiEii/AbiGii toxin family protein [Synergistaceae bacterium]